MADNPWDRTVINTRERPLSSDINQAQSQLDRTLRFFLDQLFLGRQAIADERPASLPTQGFLGNGFKIRQASPLAREVVLSAGQGFQESADLQSSIGGVTSVDDISRYKPLVALDDVTIVVDVADSTFDRIDIVEVVFNRRLADPTSRDVLNPTSGAFEPTSVNKTLAWSVDASDVGAVTAPDVSTTAIGYKAGNPSATPTTPPTTSGYIKIAEIVVAAGVTQIIAEDIKDLRNLLAPFNMRYVAAQATLLVGTPILQQLIAPPGVLVAANNTGGASRLYIVAGDVTATTPVVIGSGVGSFTDNPGFGVQIVNVDAALKAELQIAADTNPVLNLVDDSVLTVGQPVIRVDVAPGVGIYGFQVWW